jgi:fructose-1,6-bisphosphatase I
VNDIGYSQAQNSSGETQLQLDIQSDLIIEEELSHVDGIHTIASEEKELPMVLNENGHYYIAFDPLDGSSLVDVNLSVGSIFGIYEGGFSGAKMVASCYVVYGPRVELVFAHEGKVSSTLPRGAEYETHIE